MICCTWPIIACWSPELPPAGILPGAPATGEVAAAWLSLMFLTQRMLMTKPTTNPARPTTYLVLFTLPLRSQLTVVASDARSERRASLTLWSESVSRILFRFSTSQRHPQARWREHERSGDGHSSRRRIAPRAQATYPETVARRTGTKPVWRASDGQS